MTKVCNLSFLSPFLPPSHVLFRHFIQTRQLHDVNGWTEGEVADWVYSLGDSKISDLGIYAELFVKNNITGRLLFLLTGDDLLQIGVFSVGHRREIMVRGDLVPKLRRMAVCPLG